MIKKSSFNTTRPLGIPNLTAARMEARLEWVRIHAFYEIDDWKEVSLLD
jgi:hypothetical protein